MELIYLIYASQFLILLGVVLVVSIPILTLYDVVKELWFKR